MSDSHSYTETMATLFAISPHEILLHDGTRTRILSQKIEASFGQESRQQGGGSGVRGSAAGSVIFISRMYFDQDKGAELLKNVIVGKVDADLVAKYTVLAGCFCLLR